MTRRIVTWVLVADGTRAKVHGNDGPGKGIYPALERDFQLVDIAPTHEMVSDREGRGADPTGGGHHAMDPKTDPKRHAIETFHREIADVLEATAREKLYDRLVVVAPPRTLGDLRAALGPHAAALVKAEIEKDYVKLPPKDLERRLIELDALV